MDAWIWMAALAVGAGLGVVAVGVGLVVAGAGAPGALDIVEDEGPPDDFARPFTARLTGPGVESLQRFARSVTPAFWIRRLARNVSLAGLTAHGVQGVLAMKGLLALGGMVVAPVLAAVAGRPFGSAVVWSLIGAATGFFAPDILIARRATARQDDIRRSLPEALDLMAICMSAGVGLEGAIALVAQRLPGPLGEELNRFLQEVQLGASRREALHNLRERTDVHELSAFTLALAQADALGTPLSEVLRVQAAEMRTLRRQRAREQAAKTPVKLLVPLLIGIFPALGVVVIGPAIIMIARTL